MKHLSSILTFAFTCIFLALSAACVNNASSSIEREELFSLEIGPMEDQIALYNLDGTRGIRKTGFTMRDGLFYIADGNSGKIVRYNSYGDLLFMIYNEETNPVPLTLKTNIAEDEQATRWAHTHPLEEPGWITVDSRKHIYVEDRLHYNEHRTDTETRALLDGIILHFDQDGRFINYLGREGMGGSPFPRIVGLSTSVKDELAVICRLPGGWEVYWFNSSGMLLFLVKITSDDIPILPEWPQALAMIDSISASVDSRQLYIKVDYTHDTFDQSTKTRTGSEPVGSTIWILNAENGSYMDPVEIPLFELIENGKQTNIRLFYSILGIANNGIVLLYFPIENGYSLLFINVLSREQRRTNIRFSAEDLGYNDFFLSTEGILCAMMSDSNVKMVWWRTDRVLNVQ